VPAVAATIAPAVVVLSKLPEAIEVIARLVVVAAVPVALPNTKLPVRVVEAEVSDVPVAFTKSRSAKCEVEEAKRPDCAQNGEEVAAATTL